MRMIRIWVAIALVAGVGATPVVAGLDFGQSFAVGPGAFPAGPPALLSILPGGVVDPAGIASFVGNGAFPINIAVLDVSWAPGSANANTAAYNPNTPDLVIYFGSISGGSGGILLTSVGVSEDGTNFVTQNFGEFVASSWSGGKYRIFFNDAIVSPNLRDVMVAARFTFTYTPDMTFTIDGVATPEPATFALFGLGLLGIGGTVLRRRKGK